MKFNYIFVVVTILHACLISLSAQTLNENNKTVAEVNGKPIYEVAVWMPVPLLEILYPASETSVSNDQVQDKAEERLENEIIRILKDEAVERLMIHTNPETVEEMLQERLQLVEEETGQSLDELFTHIQQHAQALVAGLRAIHSDPDTSDEIYEELLDPDGIDSHTWDLFRATYADQPERIDALEANIPQNSDELLERTRENIQRELQYTFLDRQMVGHLSGGEDVRQAHRAAYWLEQLSEADVVIHDEQLEHVPDQLMQRLAEQTK